MYEFTPADPTIKRPGHETRLTDKQKILFIYVPVVWFASAMFSIVFADSQALGIVTLILAIMLNVLALWWAKIDAAERRFLLSRVFPLAVVLFGIFAIVYYLFKSRGAWGGLISTGWLILYGVGMLFALMIVSLIVTLLLVAVGLLPESILDA
jgi:hypothetical protein